jgi:hypothetical protein
VFVSSSGRSSTSKDCSGTGANLGPFAGRGRILEIPGRAAELLVRNENGLREGVNAMPKAIINPLVNAKPPSH